MKIDPYRLPITVLWAGMVVLVAAVILLPFVAVAALVLWAPAAVGQVVVVSLLAAALAVMELA